MTPTKFCTKPIIIEGIQFKYTKECISALKEFMGSNAEVSTEKARYPDAVGVAYIKRTDTETIHYNRIYEGEWVGKTQHGEFSFYSDISFKETYMEDKA